MRTRLTILVLSFFLTQCFFSKTVQLDFFGDIGNPPTTESRFVTGLALAPIAVTLDAVTSPVQLLLLAIFGDDMFTNIFAVHSSFEESHGLCYDLKTRQKLIQTALSSSQPLFNILSTHNRRCHGFIQTYSCHLPIS